MLTEKTYNEFINQDNSFTKLYKILNESKQQLGILIDLPDVNISSKQIMCEALDEFIFRIGMVLEWEAIDLYKVFEKEKEVCNEVKNF